ncbi:MAG: response regulator [Leptospira sp.]|jgi:CheY-like chemotaxis protein|nr:response regulator [Leptospira sp.]
MTGNGKKAILCVDDEAIVLNSLKGQLRTHFGSEFILEFAESADEALELIQDFDSDMVSVLVIVSDWLMPGMRGDEFLIKVHQKFPLIKKVMLTGQADPAAVERVRSQADLFRLISKPWDEKELIDTIRAGLG